MLEELKKYNDAAQYGCEDIVEKLVELSNLDDSEELRRELEDAIYYLKAIAENPYSLDSYRVLFNVLLAITSLEH